MRFYGRYPEDIHGLSLKNWGRAIFPLICKVGILDVPWCSMLVFIGAGNHGKNAGNHSRFATGTARTQWIGQRGKKRARGGVKLGRPWPKLGRTRANLNLGLTCAELRPVGSNLTCATWSWGHLAPKLPPKGPNLWQQLCNKLGRTETYCNGEHCSTRSIIDTTKTWENPRQWSENVSFDDFVLGQQCHPCWAHIELNLGRSCCQTGSTCRVGPKLGRSWS